ncbi:hypothetical protein JST97_01105 [bacterium]|nr:hypothetical protein [bacterium]
MSAPEELIFEVAFLVRPGKSAPRLDEIRRYLHQLEGVSSPRGGGSVYRYRNPDTQVSCDFVTYEPDQDYAGLSFEIEMPRPLFFALETLPLVVALSREFALNVEIVSPDNEMPGCEPSFELLLHQWQLANRDEVEALESEGHSLPRMDNQALESMWEFMLLRPELARRYNRNQVAVPPVELVRERATGKVSRVVRWRRLSASALADSDYCWLDDPPQPLQDNALIPSSVLREVAKFAFRDLSQPVNHRLFDKAKLQNELVHALQSAHLLPASDFELLQYRQVVDRDLTPILDV